MDGQGMNATALGRILVASRAPVDAIVVMGVLVVVPLAAWMHLAMDERRAVKKRRAACRPMPIICLKKCFVGESVALLLRFHGNTNAAAAAVAVKVIRECSCRRPHSLQHRPWEEDPSRRPTWRLLH